MSSTQQLLLGEGAGGVIANYIEEVFQTYLYTGTAATQTITNNIDLSTKGGLVWIKYRNNSFTNHRLVDTVRGATNSLVTNATAGQGTQTDGLTAFTTSGFTLGSDAGTGGDYNNLTTGSYASWTFRKQPKFFDIQTWTGTGSNTTISHALGSVPACIMVKRTDTTGAWQVYHRSLANTQYLVLNGTNAVATGATRWNSTTPTSTVFSLGTDATVNASGGTYVAYIFAHDSAGFGLTGTDNVISCGSVAGFATVNLGYEPQFVLAKKTDAVGDWFIYDNMRGVGSISGSGTGKALYPNLSDAEVTDDFIQIDSTGFKLNSGSGNTFVYIAIRRGPMKVPTVGTNVFAPFYVSSTSGTAQTTNFPVDWQWGKPATGAFNYEANTRLLGVSTVPTYTSQPILLPSATAATSNGTGNSYNWTNTSFGMPDPFGGNQTGLWAWRRAPGYFDVVAYTGTLGTLNVSHNLGVEPQLMIVKKRSSATNSDWTIYCKSLTYPNANPAYNYLYFTTDAGRISGNHWDVTAPTSSLFTVGSSQLTNASGDTFVNYLFATCAGVSKVGTYTGTAALQTVACGFTTGARFILIKRTDSSGDWYIWDSARGISSGNDPYFVISTAAEVTGTNYVDTDTTGFKVTAAASTTVNISAATYIFLAIA